MGRIEQFLLGALLGLALLGSGIAWHRRPQVTPILLEPLPAATAAAAIATPAASPTPAPLVIFVSGAVVRPGVYTLPPGSRVVDALAAAGGPVPEGAPEAVNQATRLVDGMQVHLPLRAAAPVVPPLSGGQSGQSGDESASREPVGPVALNRADQSTLEQLPGIGPALAGRILAYREENGPFQSVEELTKVRGIGDRLLEEIAPLVTTD